MTSETKVLIVDDDEFLLEMYALKFRELGFAVEIAKNGEEAVQKAKEVSPDVILLDVVMPKMDGFDVLRVLRKENIASKAIVLILTNLGQKDDFDRGMKFGATDYIEKASDLHLNVGRHPTLRISGQLIQLAKIPILTPEATAGIAESLIGKELFEEFSKKRERDFSYAFKDSVRFRVNTYFQKGFVGIAMRVIPVKIKTLSELYLPSILLDFTKKEQGFFIAVGPTGHGKSTTLAAMIDVINHTRNEQIITVEDPIEYIFTSDRSMVSQREVGSDTADFPIALRSMFRQDMDVAMIGEMRDHETIATAVTA